MVFLRNSDCYLEKSRSLSTFISLYLAPNSNLCDQPKVQGLNIVDIFQFISDLKINLGLSHNTTIYTIFIFLNFDHMIIWMNAINELQVLLFRNSKNSRERCHQLTGILTVTKTSILRILF